MYGVWGFGLSELSLDELCSRSTDCVQAGKIRAAKQSDC